MKNIQKINWLVGKFSYARYEMCNGLRSGYSSYNLLFLKRYYQELNKDYKVLDVGTGHFRNLRLFSEVGIKKLCCEKLMARRL